MTLEEPEIKFQISNLKKKLHLSIGLRPMLREQGMRIHTNNPNSLKVEMGRTGGWGQSQLHNFETSLGYMSPCLKIKK